MTSLNPETGFLLLASIGLAKHYTFISIRFHRHKNQKGGKNTTLLNYYKYNTYSCWPFLIFCLLWVSGKMHVSHSSELSATPQMLHQPAPSLSLPPLPIINKINHTSHTHYELDFEETPKEKTHKNHNFTTFFKLPTSSEEL